MVLNKKEDFKKVSLIGNAMSSRSRLFIDILLSYDGYLQFTDLAHEYISKSGITVNYTTSADISKMLNHLCRIGLLKKVKKGRLAYYGVCEEAVELSNNFITAINTLNQDGRDSK
jgi:hypothetical protein